MNRFFIDRPVFAAVISIVIVLVGLASMRALPIAQYPLLTPPQIVVSATYPGASAETIAQTVAAPLEQEINGVEGMLYMQSSNSSSGQMSLTVTFAQGTDPDQATINVNNRVQRATSSLPQEVTRLGVTVDEALDLDPRPCRHVCGGRTLRHHLCRQLRPAERDRRFEAHPRRRRCLAPGPDRLFDAHLAQPGQARAIRPDDQRCRHGHPGAERTIRGGAVRGHAEPARHPVHLFRDDTGAAAGRRGVRKRDPAVRRERRDPPDKRRRPRRTRRRELCHRQQAQRQSHGADRHLSPDRSKRAGHDRGCQDTAGRTQDGIPRRADLQHPL